MRAIELTQQIKVGAVDRGAERVVRSDDLPPAVVQWIGPGYRFELMEQYLLVVEQGVLLIPAGFTFDAGSVPRPAWFAISPLDLGVVAVLVHDWLYRTGGQDGLLSRGEADGLFLEQMKAEGVSWWRRRLAYLAVRVAGAGSWLVAPEGAVG